MKKTLKCCTRSLFVALIFFGTSAPASAADFLDTQISALEKQIDHYEKIVQDGGWPEYTSRKKLTPGITHDAVATLRQILTATGDLETATRKTSVQPLWKRRKNKLKAQMEEQSDAMAANFYDGRLEDAVKRFQVRHGLKADGVIGPASQRALGVSATDRLAQLYVTKSDMHQFAVQHSELGEAVIVNIPGYRLYGLEDGDQEHSMKVIVGQKTRKTPRFSNSIAYLEFNPRWYVPSSIAKKDILPKFQKDPEFARKAGFRVTQEGQQVNAAEIDWNNIDAESFNFRLTQNSGRGNALGKVKFTIPNNKAIYLHDTSKPYLFERDYRALSSGCVRVEDPIALTKFVLKHGKGMSAEDAVSTYESSQLKRLTLDSPMPVHSVYWTAMVEKGADQPSFYSDVYKLQRNEIAEKKRQIQGTLSVASK